ncbi:MAG TPA: carboxylesterase family protein [Actinomycetes bacterium]|jgi:para-nitrobenzyl esterase|nr:carboxylesterase family protein [Actinomycetes bacterium]
MSTIRRRIRGHGVLLAVAALVAGSGLLATAAFSATPTGQTSGCAPDTTVQTANGPVCGIVVGGVREWLGIPYAAPPAGDLRWAPPQPAAPWSGTLQATAFGTACQQARPNVQSSEDCLYLNVWRPPGGDHPPVMVHIHGGGFFGGSGNGDSTLLATRGHEVIVSMNYRLGIFGFLANAAFGPHSGDYGLQDQQAALRWVPNWPNFKLGQAGQVMSLAPGGDSQLMSVAQIAAAHNCGFWGPGEPQTMTVRRCGHGSQ